MDMVAVILAAGQGTRMKSSLAKVLHPLGGQPLVCYSVDTATTVTGNRPVLVVGHGANEVCATVAERALYAEQAQQLGTGHAVLQARLVAEGLADLVLVCYADMPLLSERTWQRMLDSHRQAGNVMTMLTVVADDPHGFGRVVRDEHGGVQAIVEEAACTPEQLRIRELNAGVYCFQAGWLWPNLPKLPLSAKGEYYLTDMAGLAVEQGLPVNSVACDDPDDVLGINTRVHLAEAEQVLRKRVNHRWMEAGVTLLDPAATYIEPTVTIGRDTTILPGTYLQGSTVIGSACWIGPGSYLVNSRIGNGCTVTASVLDGVRVADDTAIGPFAHRRGGAEG